jgi:hypothetical protein
MYRILMGKLLGKHMLGRPKRDLEDSIKVDLGGVACEDGK